MKEELKKEFVTPTIAVMLGDLGFNEACFNHYIFLDPQTPKTEQEGILVDSGSDCDNTKYFVKAPLWQQAIAFLKTKGVLVTECWDGWEYGLDGDDFDYTKTLEEAVLKAIIKISALIALGLNNQL